MVSAVVHAALLAAAVATTVAIPSSSSTSVPAKFSEEASYSVEIRPGGGERVGELRSGDERQYGAPSEPRAEESTHGLEPLEGVPEWKLASDAAAALIGERSPAPSSPRQPGSGFRTGRVVRLDMPRGGGGGGGSGTGTGQGLGEGADDGVEAVALSTPPPSFPEEARRSSQEGTVILRIRIDKDGLVHAADIDSTSGHSILDDAAKAAVLTWRYKPATLNHRPVSSIRKVRLVFRLE